MQGCPYEKVALARRGAGAGLRRLVVVAAAAARAGCHPFDARRPTAGARRARPTAGARAAAGAAAVGRLRALRLRVAPAAAGRRDAVRRVSGVRPPRAGRVPPRAALPARRLPRGRHSGGPRGGPAGARALARLPRAGGRLGHRRPAARGAVGRDGPERGLQAHVPLLRPAALGPGGGLRRRHARRRRRLLPGAGALRPIPAALGERRGLRLGRRDGRVARPDGPDLRPLGPGLLRGARRPRRLRAARAGVVDAMFFNNVFATVVDFWRGADVRRYLAAVDATGGIYVHRWGDAPIQSAAVRLFARGHVALPGVEYAHVSTDNLIVRNQVRCLSCVGAAAYPRRGRRTTAPWPAPSPRTRPPSPTTSWRPACPAPGRTRSRPWPSSTSSRRSASGATASRPSSARPRSSRRTAAAASTRAAIRQGTARSSSRRSRASSAAGSWRRGWAFPSPSS